MFQRASSCGLVESGQVLALELDRLVSDTHVLALCEPVELLAKLTEVCNLAQWEAEHFAGLLDDGLIGHHGHLSSSIASWCRLHT